MQFGVPLRGATLLTILVCFLSLAHAQEASPASSATLKSVAVEGSQRRNLAKSVTVE